MAVRDAEPVFFPLDKAWGLDASVYSPELKRHMVWLSGLLPYGQAEAVMERIGKLTISASSLWRTVEWQGHRLAAEAWPSKPGAADHAVNDPSGEWGKMLSMDGGMVSIRQEGWKELKVGLIGKVVSDDRPDSNAIPEMHTVPLAYTAVLGDVETFAPLLVRAAHARYYRQYPYLYLADKIVIY